MDSLLATDDISDDPAPGPVPLPLLPFWWSSTFLAHRMVQVPMNGSFATVRTTLVVAGIAGERGVRPDGTLFSTYRSSASDATGGVTLTVQSLVLKSNGSEADHAFWWSSAPGAGGPLGASVCVGALPPSPPDPFEGVDLSWLSSSSSGAPDLTYLGNETIRSPWGDAAGLPNGSLWVQHWTSPSSCRDVYLAPLQGTSFPLDVAVTPPAFLPGAHAPGAGAAPAGGAARGLGAAPGVSAADGVQWHAPGTVGEYLARVERDRRLWEELQREELRRAEGEAGEARMEAEDWGSEGVGGRAFDPFRSAEQLPLLAVGRPLPAPGKGPPQRGRRLATRGLTLGAHSLASRRWLDGQLLMQPILLTIADPDPTQGGACSLNNRSYAYFPGSPGFVPLTLFEADQGSALFALPPACNNATAPAGGGGGSAGATLPALWAGVGFALCFACGVILSLVARRLLHSCWGKRSRRAQSYSYAAGGWQQSPAYASVGYSQALVDAI